MSAFAREATASHYGYGYQRLSALEAKQDGPTIAPGAHAKRKRTVRRQRPLFASYATLSGHRL